MNNRAITLSGANEIFSAVGIEIKKDEQLGYYYAVFNDSEFKAKTLKDICQTLLVEIKNV